MSPSRKRRFRLRTANGENSIRRQRRTAEPSLSKRRARASRGPRPEVVKSTTKDLNHRRAVWEALSDLFLDTDDPPARSLRIGVLATSPYSLDQLEKILIDEVYPVCRPNRSSVAGEWTGLIQSGLRLESSVVFNRPSAVFAYSILADYPPRVGRSGSRRKMQFNSSALRIMPAKPEDASQFGNARPEAGSRPIRRSRIVAEKFVGLSSHDRGCDPVSHVARRPMAKRRVESNDARIRH